MELFAYIDPGTGSLFIQAVIGGVLGAFFVFRNFVKSTFYRVKMVFNRESALEPEQSED